MCKGCIRSAVNDGRGGLNITMEEGCPCPCPGLPVVDDKHPVSEELCSRCGHAHATGDYAVKTPGGLGNARIRFRPAMVRTYKP